jgi:anti-anti-sigma factor
MAFDIRETGEPRTYRLIGELDISNAETLAAAVERDAQEEGDISLDLSELIFMDSSGIRVLLRIIDRLDGRGELVLLSPTSSVRHVISVMGLEDRGSLVVVESAEHDIDS